MERRKLLATTGAVSLTAAAAVIAIGSNFGVFGLNDGPAKAGHLQPVAATSSTTLPEPPAVIYLDVQDPPLAPASTPPASVDGAHQMDDDSSEHDDHGYDGEEHETERDDD